MDNTTLIRVTGIVIAICVVSITAILIWYPGTPAEKLLAAGVIAGLITVSGGQFANYKQSGENAATLAVMAPKVDQAAVAATVAAKESKAAVAAVADNTAVTEGSQRELGEIKQVQAETHALVNGRTEELKQALKDLAAQQKEMAEQKAEIAAQQAQIAAMVELTRTTLAELKAHDEGVKEGREQVTSADTMVVEAPVLILPPAEGTP